MTDIPPTEDDDLLAGATVAPEALQHRSHRSHRSHRRKGLKPLDIAGIVVAVLVVIGVVIVISKGHKSTSSATATTVASATPPTSGSGSPTATKWTYTNLDGKTVTVAKGTSGSERFAVYQNQSLPLAIITVDKAMAKNDCAAAETVYNSDKTANPSSSANSNDRRSAFAHYALVQARTKGCAWAKAIPS